MKILFLTQLFEPEAAMKGVRFVRALQQAGHSVRVVTGFPNYPGGKIYPGYRGRITQAETIDGVEIRRIPLLPSHSQSSIGRAVHFLSFSVAATLYLLLRARRYDLIYVGHPGVTTGLAAMVGGGVWGKPYVLDIQDLWPDSLFASGLGGAGRMARMIRPLCDAVHGRAAHIIAQSRGMARILVERGVAPARVSHIYNWASAETDSAAPTSVAAGIETLARPGRLTICYGGNMGRMQQLDTAIRAARIADQRGAPIDLVLFGGGVERQRLEQLAQGLGATNVRFLGRVDPATANARYLASDGLFLGLAPDPLFAVTIPSKAQNYLTCGRPIIGALTGEIADVLRASGAAIIAAPGDASALADAFVAFANRNAAERMAMGERGAAFYAANLAFDAAIRETDAILRQVHGQQSPK